MKKVLYLLASACILFLSGCTKDNNATISTYVGAWEYWIYYEEMDLWHQAGTASINATPKGNAILIVSMFGGSGVGTISQDKEKGSILAGNYEYYQDGYKKAVFKIWPSDSRFLNGYIELEDGKQQIELRTLANNL